MFKRIYPSLVAGWIIGLAITGVLSFGFIHYSDVHNAGMRSQWGPQQTGQIVHRSAPFDGGIDGSGNLLGVQKEVTIRYTTGDKVREFLHVLSVGRANQPSVMFFLRKGHNANLPSNVYFPAGRNSSSRPWYDSGFVFYQGLAFCGIALAGVASGLATRRGFESLSTLIQPSLPGLAK